MRILKCIMPLVEGLAIFIALMILTLNLGIEIKSWIGVVVVIGIAGLSFLSGVKAYFLYGGKTK